MYASVDWDESDLAEAGYDASLRTSCAAVAAVAVGLLLLAVLGFWAANAAASVGPADGGNSPVEDTQGLTPS